MFRAPRCRSCAKPASKSPSSELHPFAVQANSEEHNNPSWMRTVLRRQERWFFVQRNLRAEAGVRAIDQVEVTGVAEGISLHPRQECIVGDGKLEQLVAAIDVFNAPPNIVL